MIKDRLKNNNKRKYVTFVFLCYYFRLFKDTQKLENELFFHFWLGNFYIFNWQFLLITTNYSRWNPSSLRYLQTQYLLLCVLLQERFIPLFSLYYCETTYIWKHCNNCSEPILYVLTSEKVINNLYPLFCTKMLQLQCNLYLIVSEFNFYVGYIRV